MPEIIVLWRCQVSVSLLLISPKLLTEIGIGFYVEAVRQLNFGQCLSDITSTLHEAQIKFRRLLHESLLLIYNLKHIYHYII